MEEGEIQEPGAEHHVETVPKHEEQTKEEPKKEFKLFKKKEGPSLFRKLKDRLVLYRRTLEVARKPGKEEYITSMKITGVGILLIGLIGFIIYMIYHLVI